MCSFKHAVLLQPSKERLIFQYQPAQIVPGVDLFHFAQPRFPRIQLIVSFLQFPLGILLGLLPPVGSFLLSPFPKKRRIPRFDSIKAAIAHTGLAAEAKLRAGNFKQSLNLFFVLLIKWRKYAGIRLVCRPFRQRQGQTYSDRKSVV